MLEGQAAFRAALEEKFAAQGRGHHSFPDLDMTTKQWTFGNVARAWFDTIPLREQHIAKDGLGEQQWRKELRPKPGFLIVWYTKEPPTNPESRGRSA